MAEVKHVKTDRIFIPTAKFTVKHRDYFNLGRLYRMMHEWVVEEGFAKRSGADFPETFYLFRESPKMGNEVIVWWRLMKEVDNYYRYVFNIDLVVIMLKDTEAMHGGQKFKTNWGEVAVQVEAMLELDWQHETGNGWRDHAFLKHINEIFHKRIFKKETEYFKLDFYRYAYRFQDAVKVYLQKATFLPERELRMLWPELGLGETK